MIKYINELKDKKNLLAFSGGEDSSALFDILMTCNIEFDIVIINYNMRKESMKEVEYANELASKHKKNIFLFNYNNKKFDERSTRDFRHQKFKEVINNYKYDNLITGHHLNDRMEWFLMQLTKGAGLVELNGFKGLISKDNYTLIRPLIETSKDKILNYLKENKVKYFTDKSNFDESYTRNYFRHQFATKLINEYQSGITKSFEYLDIDEDSFQKLEYLKQPLDLNIDNYYVVKKFDNITDIRNISKVLKEKFQYVLTSKQREDIIKQKFNIDIGGIIAIGSNENTLHMTFKSKEPISKEYKNIFRINNIPVKNRSYIFNKLKK